MKNEGLHIVNITLSLKSVFFNYINYLDNNGKLTTLNTFNQVRYFSGQYAIYVQYRYSGIQLF